MIPQNPPPITSPKNNSICAIKEKSANTQRTLLEIREIIYSISVETMCRAHLLYLLPFQLPKIKSLRILSIGLLLSTSEHFFRSSLTSIANHSWTSLIEEVSAFTISILSVIRYQFPLSTTHNPFGLNSLQATSACVGSCQMIGRGTSNLLETWKSKPLSTKQKTINIVSGLFQILIGLSVFGSVIHRVSHFQKNLLLFNNLDSSQKEGVIKHNSLHTLNAQKTCNAIIIDGASSKWGRIVDDHPNPFIEFLYQNCETRYYRADSPDDFSFALSDASRHFQSKVDILSLYGHATPHFIQLGRDYGFFGRQEELDSLTSYLPEKAQVFLIGCNTATKLNNNSRPLAEVVSAQLPGRRVTGFAAHFHPFLNVVHRGKDGLFEIDSYSPIKAAAAKDSSWGFTTMPNTVHYIDGQIL